MVNPGGEPAGVLESADSRALKALGPQGREGSSPSSGTFGMSANWCFGQKSSEGAVADDTEPTDVPHPAQGQRRLPPQLGDDSRGGFGARSGLKVEPLDTLPNAN